MGNTMGCSNPKDPVQQSFDPPEPTEPLPSPGESKPLANQAYVRDHYDIDKKVLGRGQYGEVFRATHRDTNEGGWVCTRWWVNGGWMHGGCAPMRERACVRAGMPPCRRHAVAATNANNHHQRQQPPLYPHARHAVFAIKRIVKHKVRRQHILRREMEFLLRANHPNIINVVDLIEDANRLWIVQVSSATTPHHATPHRITPHRTTLCHACLYLLALPLEPIA